MEEGVKLTQHTTAIDCKKIIRGLENCDVGYWLDEYQEPGVMDGTSWQVEVILSDGTVITKHGCNSYPGRWKQFCRLISRLAEAEFE